MLSDLLRKSFEQIDAELPKKKDHIDENPVLHVLFTVTAPPIHTIELE